MHHNQIAILFDTENIKPHEILDSLFQKLSSLNYTLIYPRKMIVNDLNKLKKNELSDILKKYRLELICTYGDVRKNLLDFRLYIEALDLAYTMKDIEAFCIVSNDADYAELAIKLHLMGKAVIGVGSINTKNEDYQKLFDNFFFVEDLKASIEKKETIKKKKKLSPKDTLLQETINESLVKAFNDKKAKLYYSNIVAEIKKNPNLKRMKISQEKLIKLGYQLEFEDNDKKETAYIKLGEQHEN